MHVDYLSLKHICVFVCLSTDSIYRLTVPVCLLNTKMFAREIFLALEGLRLPQMSSKWSHLEVIIISSFDI